MSISIHALREEGDLVFHGFASFAKNFYPRPPRGGRPRYAARIAGSAKFLSTPSARRATHHPGHHRQPEPISIHALREEGDAAALCNADAAAISIHALREEGDVQLLSPAPKINAHFYPRPRSSPRCGGCPISIHALREEGDPMSSWCALATPNFYPRPPRGGRPGCQHRQQQSDRYFYPRPPRGGRQCGECKRSRSKPISIHALREEGDPPAF